MKLKNLMFWKMKNNALISFPKSGRTWLRVMLDEMDIDLQYSHAKSGHRGERTAQELDTSIYKKYDKILFLHRDPRDTAVSGYHQKSKRLNGYDGTISDFIRDPRHGVEKIALFNQMWIEFGARKDDFHIVSYEELKSDTVGTLIKIAEFLNAKYDILKIEKIVEASRFDRMKEKERNQTFDKKYGGALTPRDSEDENSFKVRRGVVGGYVDELSSEDALYCDQVVAAFRGRK